MLDFEHVLDGRHAADRFLRERAEFQCERANQLAVNVYGAAAHPRDDPRLLHFVTQQANQDHVLLRPDGVIEHADHFEIDLFHLVALEDRVSHTLHAGFDFTQREERRTIGRASREDAAKQQQNRKQDRVCAPDRAGHKRAMIRAGMAGSK